MMKLSLTAFHTISDPGKQLAKKQVITAVARLPLSSSGKKSRW